MVDGGGLVGVLLGQAGPAYQATSIPGLSVMAAGKPVGNSRDLVASMRMRDLIASASSAFDMVIVEGGPLRSGSDSAVLASFVHGTVLLVDRRHTHASTLTQALDLLEAGQAPVQGFVLYSRVRGSSKRPGSESTSEARRDALARSDAAERPGAS